MFGLSAATIASLVLAFIKLAVSWFERNQEEALKQAGADREKLRQIAALGAVSSALKDVDERFELMSDEEVLEEISKEGWWRD